jgi:4-hydroxybenzoyl-CoA thioesterase
MARTHITQFTVEFGDCDPAQIVFYPNFFKWMDAAALHFFAAAGVPSWHRRDAGDDVIGIPLVQARAHFVAPATYGDRIAIETSITEWRKKSFVMQHIIRRGETVLVEGHEVRVFARCHPEDPSRIQALPPPEMIRKLFE